MEKLTIENFSFDNIAAAIENFSHIEQVKVALYCAELVLPLCDGESDAPAMAIQAVKNWLENPTRENGAKCEKIADVAYTTDVTAYTAADAVVYAAYAVAYTTYSLYAAAAAYAAYTVARTNESIKQKICDYLNDLNDVDDNKLSLGESWIKKNEIQDCATWGDGHTDESFIPTNRLRELLKTHAIVPRKIDRDKHHAVILSGVRELSLSCINPHLEVEGAYNEMIKEAENGN